jgi:hypothetical protein
LLETARDTFLETLDAGTVSAGGPVKYDGKAIKIPETHFVASAPAPTSMSRAGAIRDSGAWRIWLCAGIHRLEHDRADAGDARHGTAANKCQGRQTAMLYAM